jgi:hypothetical protein
MARSEFSKKLRKRSEQNYENQSKGYSSGLKLLDLSKHDVEWYKPKDDGRNHIVIIPYITAVTNEELHGEKSKAGDPDYLLDILYHKTGTERRTKVICPRTMGKTNPCPICEEQTKVPYGQKDLWASLKATRSPFYFVINLEENEEKVRLWQTPYAWFEGKIDKINKAKELDGDPMIWPFDIEDGLEIVFSSQINGKKGYDFDAFKFPKLNEPFDKNITKKTFALDDCMVLLSYDELQKLHLDIEDADIDTGNNEEEEEQQQTEQQDEVKEEKPATRQKRERKQKPKEEENKCPAADKGGVFGKTCQTLEKDDEGYTPCDKSCEDELFQACADIMDS